MFAGEQHFQFEFVPVGLYLEELGDKCIGIPRKPLCVSVSFLPASKRKSCFVQVFPMMLLRGTSFSKIPGPNHQAFRLTFQRPGHLQHVLHQVLTVCVGCDDANKALEIRVSIIETRLKGCPFTEVYGMFQQMTRPIFCSF